MSSESVAVRRWPSALILAVTAFALAMGGSARAGGTTYTFGQDVDPSVVQQFNHASPTSSFATCTKPLAALGGAA